MDNFANLPGIGPLATITPGPNTPGPYLSALLGLTDGTNLASASKNLAVIYNMVGHEMVSLIKAAGLTPDVNNWAQVQEAVKRLIGLSFASNTNLVPAGALSFFAQNAVPSGWLAANGAEVSVALYPALYAAIGNFFGINLDPSLFVLPDLRGVFLRGLDSGRNIDPGRVWSTLQLDGIGPHQHPRSVAGFAENFIVDTNNGIYTSTNPGFGGSDSGFSAINTGFVVDGATETRPINVAFRICIKY